MEGDQSRDSDDGQNRTLIGTVWLCTPLPLYLNVALVLGPHRWSWGSLALFAHLFNAVTLNLSPHSSDKVGSVHGCEALVSNSSPDLRRPSVGPGRSPTSQRPLSFPVRSHVMAMPHPIPWHERQKLSFKGGNTKVKRYIPRPLSLTGPRHVPGGPCSQASQDHFQLQQPSQCRLGQCRLG